MTQSSIWVFPKIMVPPNHPSILIGFSIIFTIHFGVPLFLETSIWPHSSIAALLCMRIIQSTMLLRCPRWGSTGSSTGRLLAPDHTDACPPKNGGSVGGSLHWKNKGDGDEIRMFIHACCNVSRATYLVLGCLEEGQVHIQMDLRRLLARSKRKNVITVRIKAKGLLQNTERCYPKRG